MGGKRDDSSTYEQKFDMQGMFMGHPTFYNRNQMREIHLVLFDRTDTRETICESTTDEGGAL